MTQLVSEANLPKTLEKRARSLTKALKAPPIKPEILQSAKALLLEAMATPAEQQKEASPGLFGGLFAKDKANVEKPVDEPDAA